MGFHNTVADMKSGRLHIIDTVLYFVVIVAGEEKEVREVRGKK